MRITAVNKLSDNFVWAQMYNVCYYRPNKGIKKKSLEEYAVQPQPIKNAQFNAFAASYSCPTSNDPPIRINYNKLQLFH